MSLHSFRYATKLHDEDAPFHALIMAAMWKADTENLVRLRVAFPETWVELQARYNAPLGMLPDELAAAPKCPGCGLVWLNQKDGTLCIHCQAERDGTEHLVATAPDEE